MEFRRALVSILAATVVFPGLCLSSELERKQQDIAYGAHEKQRYDAYLPASGSANGAAVVFLHGGAWRFGDKRNRGTWVAKARHLNAKGTAFFSVNTRLLPEADPLEQTRDLAKALGHIQGQARDYGITPERIVLMGHSAGAHVAALLSADPSIGEGSGLRRWAGTVVLDTAAVDTEALMRGDPARLHREAFGSDAVFWRKTSPKARLKPAASPFLIVCSTFRRNVCAFSRAFAQKARSLGGTAEVLPVPLKHRQINVELGTSGKLTREVDRFLQSRLRY